VLLANRLSDRFRRTADVNRHIAGQTPSLFDPEPTFDPIYVAAFVHDLEYHYRPTAARSVVDYGISKQYDPALEALTEARYDRWRDFDPEDTLRFYALRMKDVGFIKSTPQQIITSGTSWEFLNELKRELKT